MGVLILTDVLPFYLGALLGLIVIAPLSFWVDYRKRRQRYEAGS
ncbi:hypothetical protein [Angustibacter speluncae]